MKNVLILHAWTSSTKNNWYMWLKEELTKKGYEVYLPELPTMSGNRPDLSKMLTFLGKNFNFEKDTVVIGHSLGAVLGMRLGEKYKFGKLITVSGWDYNDLCAEHKLFWKTMINHKKIKKNVKEIVCMGSDNDPYYTAISFEDTSNRLGGKFVLVKGAGHFNEKAGFTKLPQILKYL